MDAGRDERQLCTFRWRELDSFTESFPEYIIDINKSKPTLTALRRLK